MDLDTIYSRSLEIARSYEDFRNILVEFKEKLEFDYVLRDRRLIAMPRGMSSAVFFGDIHGDIDTLYALCKKVDLLGLLRDGWYAIFLGDYIDRGAHQLEALAFIAMLKIEFPSRVITIRGNHEPYRHLIPYPHDYQDHLIERFGRRRGSELYEISLEVFDYMPLALYSPGKVLAVHGGPPVARVARYDSADEILAVENDLEAVEDILWSDPVDDDSIDYTYSYRGAGKLWGKRITQKVLEKTGVKIIVRGHEPVNGYRFNHDRKVLTLFSMKGYYGNLYASCLKIDLDNLSNSTTIEKSIVSI